MVNKSRIAVVGCQGVGKKSLIQQLVQTSSPASSASWILDTKYYSVQVQIQAFDITPQSQPDISASEFEAIILVYDLRVPNTLRQIQRFCDSHDLDSFELRFVVGNKADLVPHDPAHVQHVFSWCGEKLMEYLQTSATNQEFDQQIIIDEESSGVQYLERGLKAHMWKGLTLKPKNNNNLMENQQFDEDYSQVSHDLDLNDELNSSKNENLMENLQIFGKSSQISHNFDQNAGLNSFQNENDANSQNLQGSTSFANVNSSQIHENSDIQNSYNDDSNEYNQSGETNEVSQTSKNPNFQNLNDDDDNSSQGDNPEFAYQRLDGDDFDDDVEEIQQQQQQHELFEYQRQQLQNDQQDIPQEQQQSVGPNLDEFERLMVQVSTARERFRDFPDDVRREAAAQLALQLAEAFGITDDDADVEE